MSNTENEHKIYYYTPPGKVFSPDMLNVLSGVTQGYTYEAVDNPVSLYVLPIDLPQTDIADTVQIYIPFKSNINDLVFEYPGSLKDAQRYIDGLTQSENLGEPYIVEDFAENFEYVKRLKYKEAMKSFVFLFICLSVISYINVVLLTIQKQLNKREDRVNKVEGYLLAKSVRDYGLFNGLTYCIIFGVALLVFYLDIWSVVITTLIVILLDYLGIVGGRK